MTELSRRKVKSYQTMVSSNFQKNRRKISIHNPEGRVLFYDGPENDYGIYTRNQTVADGKQKLRSGKGKKHINFLKEEESSLDQSFGSPGEHNNTRKYNSKQTNPNQGFTMDNINELDEDSFEEEASRAAGPLTHRKEAQDDAGAEPFLFRKGQQRLARATL